MANIDDLQSILSLFTETIQAICQNDYLPHQIRAWASSAQNPTRWINKLNTQYFIVAEIGGSTVGFASLDGLDYLDFMYVHKNYQRHGIAQLLYKKIEKHALENGAANINADVSITAKPFFETMGFMAFIEQRNDINGVEIINYAMRKDLLGSRN